MSHISKVELLNYAKLKGFRTYLYYIATDDPEINISRVKNRVNLGGHNVPENLIIDRYHRSLDLLINALKATDRAYLFDNSTHLSNHVFIAEITNGQELEIKTDYVPSWVQKFVLDKLLMS